jgi:hypothetical protein
MNGYPQFWSNTPDGANGQGELVDFAQKQVDFMKSYRIDSSGKDLPQYGTPLDLLAAVPEGGMAKFSGEWCSMDFTPDNFDIPGTDSDTPQVKKDEAFDVAANKPLRSSSPMRPPSTARS